MPRDALSPDATTCPDPSPDSTCPATGVRPWPDLGVPSSGLAPARDDRLLLVHVPRAHCLVCGTAWPCQEVRYARALTAGHAVWGGHLT